jgi:hypothetical protein
MKRNRIKDINFWTVAGISGILDIYPFKKFLKGSIYPAILSLLVLAADMFLGKDPLQLIVVSTDIGLSILPSLLGFLLSAYVILFAIGNAEVVSILVNAKEPNKASMFQTVSSVFAAGLLVMVISLIYFVIGKLVLTLDISLASKDFQLTINSLVLFLQFYLIFYTLLMVKDMIVNLFNLTQIMHIGFLRSKDSTAGQNPGPCKTGTGTDLKK